MANNKDRLINISDLAKIIGLVDPKSGKPLTHTLRFWESKFTQIKPTILSGNRRYYSEKDINTVKMINYLLKDRGLTIRGAISAMKDKGNKLDDTISSSIKTEYYKNKIKLKSKIILSKIKKLNG
jgi:DNA-binding transcriptional MerR regulator